MEFSVYVETDAVTGHTYCFRLWDTTAAEALDQYSVYPELTLASRTVQTSAVSYMEWGVKTSVSSSTWEAINFTNTYTDPVFLCSVKYYNNIGNETDGDADSAVCRVDNLTGTGAQIKMQEALDLGGLPQSENIHYLVAEAGTYNNSFIKMDAFNVESTVTAENGAWGNVQSQTYGQSYTTPVVLGQVSSYNDAGWSVFFAYGATQTDVPDASNFNVGKHVGEDTDVTRSNEDLSIIVLESGHGEINGVEYEAQQSSGAPIERVDDRTSNAITFLQAFATTPDVGIVSQTGISGSDGPHPELYGSAPLAKTSINSVIMEDEYDGEQSGNTENVGFVVFETSSLVNVALDQNTFMIYQNTDAVQPTTSLAATNTVATGISSGDVFRIRMSVQAGLSNLATSSLAFKLQWGQATSTCESIVTWTDVDSAGGSGIWRGYNNPSVSSSTQITASLLNGNDNKLQSYEEENNSISTLTRITTGSRGEWDWVVQNNQATALTDYCFRMVTENDDLLYYTNYPQVTTASSWWDESFTRRRKITFDTTSSAPTTDLTNFPAAVQLNSSRINYSYTQNSGEDIRFVDSDNSTELNHEIEVWNESGTSTVWVKVPQINKNSNTDYIWMYYGSSTAVSTATTTGVWDDNFVMVQHLQESANTTSNGYVDSTKNNNHGTGVSMALTASAGIAGVAQDFDGTADYVYISDTADLRSGTGPHTREAWFKVPNASQFGTILDKNNCSDSASTPATNFGISNYDLQTEGNSLSGFYGTNSSSAFQDWWPDNDVTDDDWHYVTQTILSSDGSLYLDTSNISKRNNNGTPNDDNTSPMNIGAFNAGAACTRMGFLDGLIDEVRISKVARSTEWLAFTYCNIVGSCNSYGDEETSDAGSLGVDIVDSGGSSVSSPGISLDTSSVGYSCSSASGTFGVSSEKLRISNSTSNPQWSLTLAASFPTSVWTTGTVDFDFNDATSSGCSDGGDADSFAGQMTLNPSAGTVSAQSGCELTGISKGSQNSFSQGSVDSITLLTAGATADTDCYWDMTGVDVSQSLPAELPAGDYSIDMVLTITAS